MIYPTRTGPDGEPQAPIAILATFYLTSGQTLRVAVRSIEVYRSETGQLTRVDWRHLDNVHAQLDELKAYTIAALTTRPIYDPAEIPS